MRVRPFLLELTLRFGVGVEVRVGVGIEVGVEVGVSG